MFGSVAELAYAESSKLFVYGIRVRISSLPPDVLRHDKTANDINSYESGGENVSSPP